VHQHVLTRETNIHGPHVSYRTVKHGAAMHRGRRSPFGSGPQRDWGAGVTPVRGVKRLTPTNARGERDVTTAAHICVVSRAVSWQLHCCPLPGEGRIEGRDMHLRTSPVGYSATESTSRCSRALRLHASSHDHRPSHDLPPHAVLAAGAVLVEALGTGLPPGGSLALDRQLLSPVLALVRRFATSHRIFL